MYNTFNTDKGKYDTLKDAYNKKLKEEKDRNASFTKSIFSAAIALPERPCPPDRPPAYQGIQMYWDSVLFSQF